MVLRFLRRAASRLGVEALASKRLVAARFAPPRESVADRLGSNRADRDQTRSQRAVRASESLCYGRAVRRGKGPSSGEDEELFRRAMRGVEPLAGGDRSLPPRRRPPATAVGHDDRSARFELERWGEQIEGRTNGLARVELSRLRGGKIPIDLSIDLHRLSEQQARAEVRSALARLRSVRGRCLRIVHGRGLRSPDRPVLKDSLPGWLAEPPHGRAILAFVTAPPSLGGAGPRDENDRPEGAGRSRVSQPARAVLDRMEPLARALINSGVALLTSAALLCLDPSIPLLGRLPDDIRIERLGLPTHEGCGARAVRAGGGSRRSGPAVAALAGRVWAAEVARCSVEAVESEVVGRVLDAVALRQPALLNGIAVEYR